MRSSILAAGRPARRRGYAASIAVALVATLAPVAGQPAAVAAAPATPATPAGRSAPACPADRPDSLSAAMSARLCRGKVEVMNLRSETEQVFAEPDGTFTATVAAGVVRFRDASGWRDVDLNLRRRPDGVIAPAAHPFDLTVAGRPAADRPAETPDGSTELAAVGRGGDRVSMLWSGRLPEPTLVENRATYVDVRPGLDLVVEATRTGFQQLLVVKDRSALSQVSQIKLPLRAANATAHKVDPHGNVTLTGKDGRVIARSPAPEMWDAQPAPDGTDRGSRRPVALSAQRRPAAAARAADTELRLTPDQQWLNDPARVFPITIDPTVNPLHTTFDTYVKEGSTTDHSGANDLQLGVVSGKRARSFLSWDTTALKGKQITSAKTYFWNWWSPTCAAKSWEIWTTEAATSESRWDTQPKWLNRDGTSTATKGFNASCNDAWVNIDSKSFFQRAATANSARGFMGLRATSETDGDAFKQFRSRNAASAGQVPYSVVSYNSYPSIGNRTTSPVSACQSGAGRPYLNSKTPQLRAIVTDGEASPSTATFEWWAVGGTAKLGSRAVTGVASGSTASVVVPTTGTLTENASYKWRVQATDNTGSSPWSGFCEFTVDTTAPAGAAVASTDYPAGAWSRSAGQPGTFNLTTTSGDVVAYLYGLDTNPPVTSVSPATPGAAATVAVTPTTNGPHTLYVRTRDRAGNVSPVTAYQFSVGTAAVTAPVAGARPAGPVTLAAAGPPALTAGRFQYRRGAADAWADVPTEHVTSPTGALTWPVPMTGGATPALTWAAARTLGGGAVLEVRALLTSSTGTSPTEPVRFTVDPLASAAAAETVGPGVANLLTGDFRLDGTDASAFGMSLSRQTSSRNPTGAAGQPHVAAFGAQWQHRYATAGTLNVSWLRRTGNTVAIGSGTGHLTEFTLRADGTWQPETGLEQLNLTFDAAGDRYTVTDRTEGETATFGKVSPAMPVHSVMTTTAAGADSTFTYVYDTVADGATARARLLKIVAPTAAVENATCAGNPAARGCRVLELSYASGTTAAGQTVGDYAGQVREIRLWSTAPQATSATTSTLAAFGYDSAGRLRQAWDPRITPALKTGYDYDDAGRVVTLTPAGQLPWTFAYGNVGPAALAGPGMLLSASRPTLQPGSATTVNGTAKTTLVYDVPLSTTAGGPHELTDAAVATWGQPAAPTRAVAVFPADAVPAGNVGRGALTSSQYGRANVHYLDDNGRPVNLAVPGGHISSSGYDTWGHPTFTLTAENRELALGRDEAAAGRLQELGLATQPSGQRGAALASTVVFSADGLRQTANFAPLRVVTIGENLPAAGVLPAMAAGSEVAARRHTTLRYDQGRPADAKVANRLTGSVTGASVPGYPGDVDTNELAMAYDWKLGQITTTTTDPGGTAIVERSYFDPQGRLIEKRQPGSNGADAGTTLTTYYRPTGSGGCDGRPEWAGLVCRTEPKATVGGGEADTDELVTTTTTYTAVGAVAAVTETANGATRTTTTSYDAAQREHTVTVTGGVGTPVPTTTTEYHPETGLVAATTAGAQRVAQTHDALGRLLTYTDAAGATTRYQYDALDEVTQTADPVGTTDYAYDTTVDPRRLLTRKTDSVAGAMTARYDADGNLVAQGLPGGLTQSTGYDTVGSTVTRSYVTGSTVLLYDQIAVNVHDQWVGHVGLSEQTFSFDGLGRITKVDDVFNGVCTRRTYGFGANSTRTAKSVAVAAPSEPCADTGAVSTAHAYDSADRIVDAGYRYDAFGRTATTAAGLSLEYYANDRVRRQTAEGVRQTWDVDPTQRPSGSTVEADVDGTWTATGTAQNHYREEADAPDWTVDDVATGALTRHVKGVDDGLIATTSRTGDVVFQLTGLHGDVNLVYDPAAAAVEVRETDEYGVARSGLATGRYGWLGREQRSRAEQGATILMGARVYDPSTARFLQTDPIEGGNANAYDYCSGDPNTCVDLNGLGGCLSSGRICGKVRNHSGRNMRAGEVKGYSRGNDHIWEAWCCGRIYRHGRMSTHLVKPGKSLGGNGYDVDAFTFPARTYWVWGMRAPAKRYAKFPTYLVIDCVGGRGIWAPECA